MCCAVSCACHVAEGAATVQVLRHHTFGGPALGHRATGAPYAVPSPHRKLHTLGQTRPLAPHTLR